LPQDWPFPKQRIFGRSRHFFAGFFHRSRRKSRAQEKSLRFAVFFHRSRPGCARFFLVQTYQNGENDQMTTNCLYQMAIKYTKLPQNIPNGHKMYRHLPLQDPPKCVQIWFLGIKINHLATLILVENHGTKKSR
jgi:hypothetical protein